MRNAVIRKKAAKEQAMIRKFLLTPQRVVLGITEPYAEVADWRKMAQPIWGGAL
jgi:hypothetical protein